MTKDNQTIFQLRMPVDLHKALRLAAFEANQSMNSYICWAIANAVASRCAGGKIKTEKDES